MAIVLESWATSKSAGGTTSFVATLASGVTQGDLIVLIPSNDDTSAESFASTGYTAEFQVGGGNSDAQIAFLWKIAGASETNPTVTSSASQEMIVHCLRYSGVDANDPVHLQSTLESGSGATHAITGFTTTVPDCALLAAIGFDGGDGPTFSVNNSFTLIDDDSNGSAAQGVSSAFATRSLTGTAAIGTTTWTPAASDGAALFVVALAPKVEKAGSDTALPKIDETSSVAKTEHKTASDTLATKIDEPTLTSMQKFIALIETLLPKTDEPALTPMQKFIGISEELLPKTDEQDSSVFGSMNRPDELLLAISDAITGNKALFTVTDTLFPRIDSVTVIPAEIVSISDDPFDDQQTNVVITGSGFEDTQGTGKVEIGDNSTYGSANLEEQTVTSWSGSSITITGVVSTVGPSDQRWVFVTNDKGDTSTGLLVGTHRAHAFALADSTHILASGEDTTAQLDPPSGKTTGDFGGGRIQDDENPGDAVDISRNQYREDEWAIVALDAAILDQAYEFRVVVSGVDPSIPYTEVVIPVWTVATPAVPKPVSDTLLVSITDITTLFKQLAVNDELRISIADAMSIFSAFTRNDDLFVRLDSLSSIISSLSRADSLSIRLDYAVNLFVTLSRTDDLNPEIIDNLGTVLSYLSRADVLFPFVTDTSSVTEVFTKIALSDAISPKIDEVMAILTSLAVTDDVLPRIDDLASIVEVFARIGLSDSLAPTLGEAVSILSAFTRNDDLSLSIDDILDILSFIVGRYRWRDDDGSESTATWLAAEDTDVERDVNINTRLRIQVDTDGDTGVTQFVLQYRKVGDPDWEWRDVE